MRRYLRNLVTDRRGIALVTVLALMGILSILAAMYTLSIRTDTALRGGAARERTGFYAAEAGLNNAMAEVREYYDNYTAPGNYNNTIMVNSGAQTRAVTYSVNAVPGRNPGPPTQIAIGQPFAGLNTIPYEYTVSSVAKNMANEQEAALGAQFSINSVPIFQFLAFYHGDLEILPGPDMVLSGRIHTNSNLYLNANNTLSVADRPVASALVAANPFVQISAAGDIYRGRKDTNTCGGSIFIDMQQDTNPTVLGLDPLPLPCIGGGTSLVDKPTRDSYLGSLLANIKPLQIPTVSTLARGDTNSGASGGVFWQNADLRIVLDLTKPRLTTFCGEALPQGGPGMHGLYRIEVQDASGNVDTTKTTALHQLMCERRGAVFYNDIPQDLPIAMPLATVDPTNSGGKNDPSNHQNYAPYFEEESSVYRRVGEDTNGDGNVDTNGDNVISNNDTNYDVCPIVIGAGPLSARPAWRPDYCNRKFGAWVTGATVNGNLFNSRSAAKAELPTSWFLNNDYRRGGFYNWREHKWVRMLNVNLRALVDWNEANSNALFNAADVSNGGLVFFLSVKAGDATTISLPMNHRYGVRIFDSANLNTGGGTFARPNPTDPTGLTVASDQAVYVQGNYNYYPSMTLVDKLPAAVLGDTLNVLSQSWEVPVIVDKDKDPQFQYNNDRKTGGALGTSRNLQPADGYFVKNVGLQCANAPCPQFMVVETYGINAALIAGVDVTSPGHYNGGLENYPRFHEDWSPGGMQRALNYRGSFVSLGVPQYANGEWCGTGGGCNIYDPPARNWDYDASFNNVDLLPPLTPRVNLMQQQLFTRFYQ